MTRRDFVLIAEALYNELVNHPNDDHYGMVRRFADRLATTNPSFNRQRFIDVATGV